MADNQLNFSMDFGDSFKSIDELKKKIKEVEEALKSATDPSIIAKLESGLKGLKSELVAVKNEFISLSTVLSNADKQVFSKVGQSLTAGFTLAIQSVNTMASATQNLVNTLNQAQGAAASVQMGSALNTNNPRPGSSTTSGSSTPPPPMAMDETITINANANAYAELQKRFNTYRTNILNARAELEVMSQSTEKFTRLTDEQRERMDLLNRSIESNEAAMNKVSEPLRKVEQAMGGTGEQAKKVRNSVFSLQQVLREAPAFAYSAQTGFMALSNNLPILRDEFMKVAEATKKSENGTISWKEAIGTFLTGPGGLLSWTTAITVGVTLLTVYGDKIWEAVSGTEKLTEAQKNQKKEMEGLIASYNKQIAEVQYFNDMLKDSNLTAEEQYDLLVKIEELTGVDLTVSYTNMTDSIKAADMATKYYMDTIREEIALQVNKKKITDAYAEQEKANAKIIGIDARKKLDSDLKNFDTIKIKSELASKSARELKKILDDQAGILGEGSNDWANLLTTVAGQKLTNVDQVRAMRDLVKATYEYKKAQDIIDGATQRSIVINKSHKGSLEEKEKSISSVADKIKQNAYFELQQYGELRESAKKLNIQITGDLTEENAKRIDIAVKKYQIQRNYELLENENSRRERIKAKAEELKIETKSKEDLKKLKHDFTIDELKTLKDMNVITQDSYTLLEKSFEKSKTAADKAKLSFAKLRDELKNISGSIQEAFSGKNIQDSLRGKGSKTTTTPLFMKPGQKSALEEENIKLSVEIKKLQNELDQTINKSNKSQSLSAKALKDEKVKLAKDWYSKAHKIENELVEDYEKLQKLKLDILESSLQKDLLLTEQKYEKEFRMSKERYEKEVEMLYDLYVEGEEEKTNKLIEAEKERLEAMNDAFAERENIEQAEVDSYVAANQKKLDAYTQRVQKEMDIRIKTGFQKELQTDPQALRAMEVYQRTIIQLQKNMEKELLKVAKKGMEERFLAQKEFQKVTNIDIFRTDYSISRKAMFEKDKIQRSLYDEYVEGLKKYIKEKGLESEVQNIYDLDAKYKELAYRYRGISITKDDGTVVWLEQYTTAVKKAEEQVNLAEENLKKAGEDTIDYWENQKKARLSVLNKAQTELADKTKEWEQANTNLALSYKALNDAIDKSDSKVKEFFKSAGRGVDNKDISLNLKVLESIKKDIKTKGKESEYFGKMSLDQLDIAITKYRTIIDAINEINRERENGVSVQVKENEVTVEGVKYSQSKLKEYRKQKNEILKTGVGLEGLDNLSLAIGKLEGQSINLFETWETGSSTLIKAEADLQKARKEAFSTTGGIKDPEYAKKLKIAQDAYDKAIADLKNSKEGLAYQIYSTIEEKMKTNGELKDLITKSLSGTLTDEEKVKLQTYTTGIIDELKNQLSEKTITIRPKIALTEIPTSLKGGVLSPEEEAKVTKNVKESAEKQAAAEIEAYQKASKAKLAVMLGSKEGGGMKSSVSGDLMIEAGVYDNITPREDGKVKSRDIEKELKRQTQKKIDEELDAKTLKANRLNIQRIQRQIEDDEFFHKRKLYLIRKEAGQTSAEEDAKQMEEDLKMLKKHRERIAEDIKAIAQPVGDIFQSAYDAVNAFVAYQQQIQNDMMALNDQLTQNKLDNYDREIAKMRDILDTQQMSEAERINSEQKIIDATNERALVEKNQKISSLELQKKQIEVNKKMALAQIAISSGMALANGIAIATQGASIGGPAAPFIFAAELAAIIGTITGQVFAAKQTVESADLQTQTIDAQIAGIESSYQAGLNKGTSATSQNITGPAAPLTTFNADLVNQGQSTANYNTGDLKGYKIYVTQADIQNANNQATKITKKVTFG